MKKIIILGGGLSGLSAARELSNKGYEVTVIERDETLGGLAKSFYYKDKWIPMTYHHVLTPDKMTQRVIKDYNLEKYLKWEEVKMGFWYKGANFPLSSPLDFLKFKPLNIIEKLRFIVLAAYTLFKSDYKNLNNVPADKWIDKIVGKSVRKKVFEHLAEIKFGDLSDIGAGYLGSRLHEAAKTGKKHAYLICGFNEMVECIKKTIIKNKGTIITGATIIKVDSSEVTATIKGKTQKVKFKADKIINTLPLPILSQVAKNLPKKLHEDISKVDYQPLVCAVCGSKQRVTKTYWNIFLQPKLSFGGLFDHTILYKKGGINGERLYYMFSYVEKDNVLFSKTNKQIEEIYVNDLKKLNPHFELSWMKIFKLPFSEPKFKKGYINLPIKVSQNLYLAGVYKEYPNTRTMHTALLSGWKTARYIINEN